VTVRVEHEVKTPALVTKDEFERDWQRGYAVTIFQDEGEEVLKDPRSGREIRRHVPAVLNLCCMKCNFSTVVQESMDKHIEESAHFWPFNLFSNPYGHFLDVTIEGIDPHGYAEFVNQRLAQ